MNERDEWVPIQFERPRPVSLPGAPGPARVGLVSLGCPKNLVDSEIMLGRLEAAGHVVTTDSRKADVLIVNTCAFIDKAKQESIDALLEMAREKQTGRTRRLVVTGCLAQRYDAELRQQIPEIDATLGTGQVDQIVEAVEGAATSVATQIPLTWLPDHVAPRLRSTPGYLAYVKISEGCDCRCSFCIIPTLRGNHRSRPLDDVVAEVETFVRRGVREAVLVAQDSTRYGADRNQPDALADLVHRLGAVQGLHWLRIMYAFPATLTDPILDAIAQVPIAVKYLDLPLQHAATSVLKRMRRPAGRRHLMGLVERARAKIPGVALRTSFIVGFPGETDAEFQALVDFVAEAEFESVGVFTYSDEEGTPAFGLPGRVSPLVKHNRRRRLMGVQRRISRKHNRKLVGRCVEVLVEGPHPESEWLMQGRLASQAPEIDGCVIINEGRAAPGDFVECEITQAHDYDVVGRVVGPAGA